MKTSRSPAASVSSPELQAAAALLAAGDHEAAIAQLRQLGATNGHEPHVWRLLAEAIGAQGGDPLPELLRWTETDPADPLAHAMLGQTLHERGDLGAAGTCYRQALALDPSSMNVLAQLGSVEQGLGNPAMAVECYQLALQAAPSLHELYPSLASALHAAGRYEEATAAWSKALRLLGDEPVLHYARSESLRASGRLGEALNATERVIKAAPDDPAALVQRASLQMALGKLHDSALNYGKALLTDPDHLDAHIDFAVVLHELGLTDEAIAHLHDALRIDPQSHLAAGNLGGLLIEQGRYEDALPWLRHALDIRPDFASALNNVGTALQALGDNPGAAHHFRAAIAVDNSHIDAYRNLSIVLYRMGQYRDALENSAAALSLAPDDPDLLLNLANAQAAMGQPARSVPNLRKAAKLRPKAADIHSNLAHFLSHLGQTDEAITLWHKAIELEPGFADAYSNLLFCLTHTDLDPAVTLAVQQGFAAQFERVEHWIKTHETDANPDRRIRLAFISGDLYSHAVANFIRPVFEQLRHDASLELVVYYTNSLHDSMTDALRSHVPLWRDVAHLSDDALDARIRADRIDVLIDLSGHTGHNRLTVLARKPAPVQVTWIGYPGTTGLAAMDYFLTDPHLLPPGRFDAQYSERIAYLPASAVFKPADEEIEVGALPALQNGYFTFASFNRANKINDDVMQLWAQVLLAVPGSRLLLGALADASQEATLRSGFRAAGIADERLECHLRADMRDYLALHQRVDLCLDTFPYTGGTTTLHGLWMGVPIVTMPGASTPSRTSTAILSHLGLNDFVADTPEQFVTTAAAWAGKVEELAALRATMRERMRASALLQPDRLAGNLSAMVRLMWRRWCAGLPPEQLVLDPASLPAASAR